MYGYIALVLRQPGGGYRAVFPDVEGCRAEGRSVDEALANASAEIKAHAARLARKGQSLPEPRPASDVATLSAKHNAVGGACIQVRDLSVRVRMERTPRTAAVPDAVSSKKRD
jgi:predicted RNase H-like HicB family nuclease